MQLKFKRLLQTFAVLLFTVIQSHSQDVFKYPGCNDVTQASFNKITLVDRSKDQDLEEPIRFAVAKSGDVYFAQRKGGLKVIKTNGSIVQLGALSVFTDNELGLTGLALDPAFETNHWIYVNYEPPSPDVMKVSRFTLNGDALDTTTEKVLFSFPMKKNYCCHTGGAMQFDNKGNLWMSVGNNTRNPGIGDEKGYVDTTSANSDGDDQGHAANTNDYRGKILRFHPSPDGTYTIPVGNLKDQYASMYTDAELAKIKPEIYTMGHRNPYTIAVDTLKNLLTWGDVGPDNGYESEEFNLMDKPGFMGWPYFVGAEGNPHYSFRLGKDPLVPLNTSPNNTGVQKLPPAVGATIGYRQNAAITGPIYRVANWQTSPKKFPPHFDGKWLVADWNNGWIHAATLDGAGTKVIEQKSFINNLESILQVTIGPDGLLYTLEYATKHVYFNTDGATNISRWEYKGSPCTVGIKTSENGTFPTNKLSQILVLGSNLSRTVTLQSGAVGLNLYNLAGKVVWQYRIGNNSSQNVAIPAQLGNGIFHLRYL